MRVLYLDCFSGISGDMTVGALCDLGVKPSAFEWELDKLEIGAYHAHWERKQRQHIEGVKFTIHEGATHRHDQDEHPHEEHSHEEHSHEAHPHHEHSHGAHGHPHQDEEEPAHENHDHAHHGGEEEHHHHGGHCGHEHGKHSHPEEEHAPEAHTHAHHDDDEKNHHHEAHHHHHHDATEHTHGRGFKEIRQLIEASTLSDFVKKRAVSIFERIAIAEGKIHGMKPEEVTFHEVGALDSIADIVLACVGIEALGVERVFVSPLAEGRGWISSAHGRFPVPAPATLEILRGIELGAMEEQMESITPTGAAIVAEFGESFGPMPAMKIEKIGYGVGTRVTKNRPNVLRAVLGEAAAGTASTGDYERDTVTRVETNIDDLSPEIVGSVTGELLKAGALDVFVTPVQMKKNRPGMQLTVLCEENAVGRMAELIFRHTTAFGVRMDRVERLKLKRKMETVKTEYGDVQVKVGCIGDERVQVSPEFESCRALGEKAGVPVRLIFEAASKAK